MVARDDGLVLKVNNTSGLGGTSADYLETRLGMLPVILNGGAEKTLVMGLGTGNTLFGVLTAGARDIDCVEILSSVMYGATPLFHTFMPETLVGGRLRLIEGDARVFLTRVPDRYDLVVGDLFFPWQSETGFLYTREHFLRVRDHLTEDGLFLQWLPLHQLRWEDFNIIGFTFSEVFDHVAVFLADVNVAYPIVGLVGTKKRLKLDPEGLQAGLDGHYQRAFLEKYGLDDVREILPLYWGNEWLFKRSSVEPVVNTEDRTLVEYRSARVFEDSAQVAFTNFRRLSELGYKEDASALLEFSEETELDDQLAYKERTRSDSEAIRHFLECHSLMLREEFIRLFGAQEDPGLVRKLRDRMGEAALTAFTLAPDLPITERNVSRLWQFLLHQREVSAANNLVVKALSVAPENDNLYNKLGMSLLFESRYDEAVVCFRQAVEKDDGNISARAHLAVSLFLEGDRVRAREMMREVVDQVGYKRLSRLIRALALLILEGYERAESELTPFLDDEIWRSLVMAARKSALESGVERRGSEGDGADNGGNE